MHTVYPLAPSTWLAETMIFTLNSHVHITQPLMDHLEENLKLLAPSASHLTVAAVFKPPSFSSGFRMIIKIWNKFPFREQILADIRVIRDPFLTPYSIFSKWSPDFRKNRYRHRLGRSNSPLSELKTVFFFFFSYIDSIGFLKGLRTKMGASTTSKSDLRRHNSPQSKRPF